MIRRSLAAALALSTLATPAQADDWARVSDVGRDALVVAALTVPAANGDWNGLAQAGGGLAVAGGVTWGLKELVREERPDRSDRLSFPSGHTSISFAAAASLEERVGWEAGAPAFAIAALVGVARVRAGRHYWHDVAVGAALGTAAGLLLSQRRPDGNGPPPLPGQRPRVPLISLSVRY